MRRVAILGATGSIGQQSLDVLRTLRDTHQVVALSAHRDAESLGKLASEFDVKQTCLSGPKSQESGVFAGPAGLLQILEETHPDIVVHAVSGAAGLPAALRAAELGIDIALANKESLVMSGPLLLESVKKSGAQLLPVDSEHSALFQCLRAGTHAEVRRLWLTASGGPFRGRSRDSLLNVTPQEALAHPTWQMGKKISVDSATLMNKGLEIIEAHYLFDIPPDQIEAVVHPESVVHSLVEFYDGSFIAHMGATDMRIPIQYALSHPSRWERPDNEFSLTALATLRFEQPDTETFPAIRLANASCNAGGTSTVVFNAANERAVELFLDGHISFLTISELVARALDNHTATPLASLEQILAVDSRTREEVEQWI